MITKRAFDLAVAVPLIIVLSPVFLVIGLLIRVFDGAPILYQSARVTTNGQLFTLIKFRTMRNVNSDSGVTGGQKSERVSRLGAVLRTSRLDEIPQLVNVIFGDMSFVGPRPPLPQYVNAYPALYSRVLASKPGITGLASVIFHKREERLLSRCSSPEETDAVYRRVCIRANGKNDEG